MDMDPASVITLCKENIQPLRHGRNATQLGTALRAQEDVETHQLLMQEKQAYEDAIKNYEGDDPLEKWYEYILWVEQSYPKSGHESHVGKLLQQCLAAFEKETKYHQDRRYIRLWINYISMQKNPLELYQLIYNNGIGTMIADMYRAWAFELEQTDDNKRADEIYVLGIRAGAEPRDELEHAHQNFQLSVARRMLGRMEERNEYELSEQRQAFSSLRAIKSGRRVTNVRTGNRVRDYMPGVVSQSQQQQPSKSGVGNSKIQIYEDAPTTGSTETRGTSILDHVPIEDTVHKENTIKPGPWSQSSRKYPLIGSSIKPGFKIHEDLPNDNNYNMEKINLFPNHVCFYDGSSYPEHLTVPVFVGEAPSATITKVHYPKDLVYANNIDRSIEEIKADNYIMLYNNHQQQQQIIGHNLIQNDQQDNEIPKFDEDKINNAKANEIERQRREQYDINQRLQAEAELQRQQQFQIEKQKLENERIEAEQREIERRQAEQQQREIERQRIEQLELERQRSEQLELERQRVELELERQRNEEIERQRIEAERIEAERMEAELNRQQKLQSTNYMSHSSSVNLETNNVEHLLGQSLTVNTKEAMSVVQELWQSPINSSSSQLLSSPMPSRMPDTRSKFSFDIHMDSSMTQQHAMSTTKQHHHHQHHQQQQHQQHHHHQQQQQQQQQQSSFNIQPYHDQENHQGYVSPYSSQDPLHHQSYRAIQDPCYQYQMPQQPHHSSQLQHQIQHVPQSHMIQQHHQQHQHHLHHQISQPSHIPPLPPSSSSSQHYSPASSSHISLQSSPHDIHHDLIQQVPPQPPSSSSLSSSSSSSSHQPVMSPHMPPPQQQHHMYNNIQHMNNVRYQQQQQQQYTMMPTHQIEQPKQQQLQYPPYMDPQVDTKQSYRMPELPLIKSPGMNRRDLKYLVNNDNKENSTGLVYNIGGIDDNNKQIEQQNNLLYDESLGISPLSSGGVNDTCFTEPIAAPQNSSTPMTFRQPLYRPKESTHYQEHHHQQQQQQQQQQINIPVTQISDVPTITNEQQHQQQQNDKLSVIMETTREYISTSSGSGSSGHTRTTGFGFTSPPSDDIVNKLTTNNNNNDISVNIDNNKDIENNETSLTTNDQNLRAKIQAVHAQSPRTVQRNVDQITSEIRNNCDLRVPFKLDVDEKNNTINDDDDDNNKIKNNNDNSLIVDEPMDEVEEEEFQLPTGDINPFDKTIISGLLRKIKFPQPHHSDGYVRTNTILTKFSPSSSITLGNDQYDMEKCLGKGTYGTVMKAMHVQSNQTVALKTQRPAWVWEYYIAREIKARLTNPHMLRGYMDVTKAHVLDNASVLVSGFSKYGTLLSVTNQVKIATGKPLIEPLAIFFTIEMLQIVEHLHKCQIIHGDIKPDNFLLMHLPVEDFRPTIQLIDFGCSIDMSLFPEGTKFTQIIKTEDFTCIEMQTGRPWTYQTDLYCLAASAHCLLFGNYMRVTNTGDRWFVTSKMPRYVKKTAWEYFFTELLNIESCEKMPDLSKIRNTMEQALAGIPSVDTKFRTFSNVLNKR